MSRYRLLALDIDGTLVNSDHDLTEPTRQAVLRAKQAGLEVVLATGRRYSRTLPLVEPLGLHVPVITASGALVKDPLDHRTLVHGRVPRRACWSKCCRSSIAAGYDPMLYADTFAEGFDFYLPRLDVARRGAGRVLEHERRLRPRLAAAGRGAAAGNFFRLCHGRAERDARAGRRSSSEQLGEHLSVHVLRSPRYRGFMCEIAPVGITKWHSIERLAGRVGNRARPKSAPSATT